MTLGRLDGKSLQQGAEWIARGSLIALATGVMMRDVLTSQTAVKVLFAEPGISHLALGGVATTAVIAGSSSYRSKVRYIPETVAVDLFGSMVVGWCLAKAIAQGESAWKALSNQYYGGDSLALYDFCWASCRGSTLMSAACGIGGGTLAFSQALREREAWALDWEQKCHDLWASLLGLRKGAVPLLALLGKVVESLPFVGRQYRISQHIAPPPSHSEGVMRWIEVLDRVGAQAAYYLLWGGLHAMAFRATPLGYSIGLGIGLFSDSPLQLGLFRELRVDNKYFSFFEGGGAEFAERSCRDRFFYFACLFFGAVVVNHAFVQPYEVLLPVALGVIAAQQSRSVIRAWRST